MATFTETFDKADSATLGPNLTWVKQSGNWAVRLNRLRHNSNAGINFLRPDVVLATDNYSVEVTADVTDTSAPRWHGVMLRGDATNTQTFYLVTLDGFTSGIRIERHVAGVVTSLLSGFVLFSPGADVVTELVEEPPPGSTLTWPYRLRAEVSGSVISVFVNNLRVASVTDATLTAGRRVGLAADVAAGVTAGQVYFDDFVAADLSKRISAGGVLTPLGVTRRRPRLQLVGQVAATGVADSRKVIVMLLSGAVGAAGSFVRAGRMVLAGSSRPTGALVRVPVKRLRATLNARGALGDSTPNRSFSGQVLASGTLLRRLLGRLIGRAGSVKIEVTSRHEVRGLVRPNQEGQMVYYAGQTVNVIMEFRSRGTPTDPQVVRCAVRAPRGSVQILTYPSPGLLRLGEGVYEATVTVDEGGTWWFRPQGQGIVDAVDEVPLAVNRSAFTEG